MVENLWLVLLIRTGKIQHFYVATYISSCTLHTDLQDTVSQERNNLITDVDKLMLSTLEMVYVVLVIH